MNNPEKSDTIFSNNSETEELYVEHPGTIKVKGDKPWKSIGGAVCHLFRASKENPEKFPSIDLMFMGMNCGYSALRASQLATKIIQDTEGDLIAWEIFFVKSKLRSKGIVHDEVMDVLVMRLLVV